MPKFRVPVVVTTRGYVDVEADDLYDAAEMAEDQEWIDNDIDIIDCCVEAITDDVVELDEDGQEIDEDDL